MILGQVGLGAVAGGLVGLILCFWLATLLSYFLFLFAWYFPEICRLLADWFSGRDLIAESQQQRKYEGRLFGPRFDEVERRLMSFDKKDR